MDHQKLKLVEIFAIFEVRKFGPLLYKFTTCLKKAATWISLLADQISLKRFFLLITDAAFIAPSQCFFRKLEVHFMKKFNFYCTKLLFS